ncbi:aspartate-semialdehyde dehydrogenase [Acuticoccus sediminis]|uniref:Aspartate-semialdehyde dehydrogenase n=1 Tax=Acuticoccus sediminis TaxID=2184697 RepID=A0A8B2P120_9HYPH|nr:aspartate-semialdehyde dehydrogenase [Acuticoccus sediminis]RAI04135.1 aspartate-semialdehyde dehydrogenase [Acuticoccus sediminis]
MSSAKRTDPKLWEDVKREITRSDKGGRAGEWSARKAQLAVSEYKRRGGGYVGPRSPDNDLDRWTAEDWGTKSGKRSMDTGERYLPRKAREALSDEEYRRTSAKKRRDSREGQQFSHQPDEIAAKTAKHRHGSALGGAPSKSDLMQLARMLDISGRSRMDKDDLKDAVLQAATDDDTASKGALMTLARMLDVSGRSEMSKSDLRQAIAEATHSAAPA